MDGKNRVKKIMNKLWKVGWNGLPHCISVLRMQWIAASIYL